MLLATTLLRHNPAEVPEAGKAAMAAEGRATPATMLFAASRQLARLTNRTRKLFAAADAVLMPVLSSAPPPVGRFDLAGSDPEAHMAALPVKPKPGPEKK